jgi:hypothetical protein
MKRPLRILVELFAPPLVAATIYSLVVFVASRDAIMVKAFLLILLFAYVFAGIPSVIFTIVLEFSFATGLAVRSRRTVLLASALGILSGCAVALMFARGFDNQRGAFTVFPALGLVSGFSVGAVVRRFAV